MTRVSGFRRKRREELREIARVPPSGLVGMAIASFLVVGCFVPPDGRLAPELRNYPPVVDPDAIGPASSVIEARPTPSSDCAVIDVAVCVEDFDDDELVFRCVADAETPFERAVVPTSPLGRAGSPRRALCRVAITEFVSRDETTGHSLSLLVTDAPRFAMPDTATRGLSLIDADPDRDGVEDHALIEARWTVHFHPSHVCARAELPECSDG
ncbi:MAG: hypothetical protein HYV07_30540 [Deltaproteobacteria bacterium]|nr:hypothetical protein [Deltaproteobacteria bacterium]